MTIVLILIMKWIPHVLSWGCPVIPLLMDSVYVPYNTVNKIISCFHIFIPVGEGQANEDLQLSFPAYYLLPPSIVYIQLPHFLTEPQCILNFTHHSHGHHTIIIYGTATCMHAKHYYYYYYYFTLVFHHHYYYLVTFLGMSAKLPKVTIKFVISVHLSVPVEQLSSHWMDFHETWYFCIKNLLRKFKFDYNLTRLTGTLPFSSYLAQFFLEWVMLQTKVVEQEKHTFYVQ